MKKSVIVLGASTDPSRYSNRAFHKLTERGFDPILLGAKKGKINGVQIQTEWPVSQEIYAITVYLRAKNQIEYYDNILSLTSTRVIFNPGSENKDLLQKCYDRKINAIEACSLVLLTLGDF